MINIHERLQKLDFHCGEISGLRKIWSPKPKSPRSLLESNLDYFSGDLEIIYENFRKKSTKMILQIHDELIFEIPQEKVSGFSRIIISEMENAIPLSIPLKVNISCNSKWEDLYK
jgi:hypothetical protein